MANIILMSGKGKRFSDDGYLLPKPLIPVSGRPMFYLAIDAMPPADKWIFVVRSEYEKEYGVTALIKKKIPDAIVALEDNPTGQAPSCLFALDYLDADDDMFVAACDNSFIYDNDKFEQLKKTDAEMIVWSFTRDELLRARPEAWGWLKLDFDQKTVVDMSVKIPISDDPFNDHAVVATFYYKNIEVFRSAYRLMIEADYRINNEFYLDSLPVFYGRLGKKSVIFDVDLYVGWGKPSDLYFYQLMDYYYQAGLDLNNIVPTKADLWNKYFKGIYADYHPSRQ